LTLINRLTLFTLASLGVVLVTFSGAIYLLARTHLLRQVDERAVADLGTLVAAVELEPDGLEWDRGEHTLWPAHRPEPAVWAIFDAGGKWTATRIPLDCSNLTRPRAEYNRRWCRGVGKTGASTATPPPIPARTPSTGDPRREYPAPPVTSGIGLWRSSPRSRSPALKGR
jgi:hypothetical protein